MLDMLGEDARAAVGKVKQLQSQGATPDQVQAQMMEAARNGLLPISVAFAAQKALQRKNPPAPPAQGTVMSEMLSQLQQSQDPREQGIAGLENPVMDNAQYAGGGIVAFAEAGAVGKKKEKRPLTPEEEAEYQRLRQYIQQSIAPRTQTSIWENFGGPLAETSSAPPRDPAVDKVLERFEPRYKELQSIRNEWEAGTKDREAVAGAEQLSQQAGLGALPAAPGAPAAATNTDTAGIASLTREDIQKYLTSGGQAPERTGFGISAPKVSSAGYDQAIEQAAAQYAPTADAQKSQDTIRDEILAGRARLGIGQAGEKQREKLGKKREELEGERKRSKLEEIGMGFLTEGVAAASRGESTLGALAGGLGAGLKGAKLSKEKLDAAEDKLDEREAALDQQKEALLLQGDSDALRRWEVNQNNLRQDRQAVAGLRVQQGAMRLNIDQFNIGNDFKLKLAEAAAAASRSKVEKLMDPYIKAAGKAFEVGDEASAMKFLNYVAQVTAASAAGVQTELIRQQGKAAESKLLTNPAGAQGAAPAGGGTWGKSTVVNQ